MNKELKSLCMHCEHIGALGGKLCPFRSISNEYCDEVETIEKDLEILNIFKKYLSIEIKDKPCFDETYSIGLKEDKDEEWDYTIIFVNKEEKDLLKEWYNGK